uniref:Pentacotripeptide-repeat region of PRORP domain-containing protein n=1 Tax=Setaria viridis TaxID=4556 RepID=A0A4U6WKP2_SETVI|nr:hypothetical protein SEVIR_1G142800v2 [Setaria viridis]
MKALARAVQRCRFVPQYLTQTQILPRRRRHLHSHRHSGRRRPPSLVTIARAVALLPTARLLLRGRMLSSASAAAALLPFPPPSSSDESDDAKTLRSQPVLEPEVASPPPQQQQLRQWLELERDCNMAMKALACVGDVDQVVNLFAELMLSASSAGVVPSVLCYNTLLNALVEDGRAAETRKVFDEMLATGVAPNVSSFNILVKLYAWRTVEFHLAYKEIHGMRVHKLEPDVSTYSTLVTGLCQVGKLDEAWGVLDWMLQEGCCPMVHTYTPIVQGYCREGRIEEARKLIDFMEDSGCPPNAVTYNVLIRALCDDARFDEVKQVLAEIKMKGQKPNTVTYNIYMDALSKKGMAKEALQQFEDMQGEGLYPTAFTLSIILNCLCCNSRFSQAISLLERSTELNWCAAVAAYNTVMSRLCDTDRCSAVLELLVDMIKKDERQFTSRGTARNMQLYHLCRYAECGNSEKKDKNEIKHLDLVLIDRKVVCSFLGAALQGPAMLIIQYEPTEPWQLAPCPHEYPPLPQWRPPRRHWSPAPLC